MLSCSGRVGSRLMKFGRTSGPRAARTPRTPRRGRPRRILSGHGRTLATLRLRVPVLAGQTRAGVARPAALP
ncbi:hypothetical protein YT1_3140 [Rhodococcus ruber]|nr:hypothetical protein YT1_3140 [Rhodococcus ruber]